MSQIKSSGGSLCLEAFKKYTTISNMQKCVQMHRKMAAKKFPKYSFPGKKNCAIRGATRLFDIITNERYLITSKAL